MYKLVLGIARTGITMLWGLRVEGLENIPPSGGAIIAANHVSMVDPVAVAAVLSRPVHFMAKAELFSNPITRSFFSRVHAFPVKRGLADRNAIRQGIEVVNNGNLLGIFPEGTRGSGEELLPLQGGAAMIALKTGAPIIPCVVLGTSPKKFRRAFMVRIGPPIFVEAGQKVGKEEISQLSAKVLAQFTTLLRRNM